MIHVAFDTSAYRSNPRRDNLYFRAIVKLASANLMELHVPYIIEREFQTQESDVYSKSIDKTISGLSELLKKQIPEELNRKIQPVYVHLNSEKQNILRNVEGSFVKWLHTINASRHPLCIEQAEGAFEAYFKGKPPFKEKKVRKDIPDSFFVQAAKDIAKATGHLHIVVSDSKLREAFKGNEKFDTYKNLSSFIDSQLIQTTLTELDLSENFDKYITAIERYENENHEITNRIDLLICERLKSQTIGSSTIPERYQEAIISQADPPEKLILDISDSKYFGSGHFGIPFSLSIIVSATFSIHREDYACLDTEDEMSIRVTGSYNEYFEAEGTFKVYVNGIATIVVDRRNIDFISLGNSIDPMKIKIDTILSIDYAEDDI